MYCTDWLCLCSVSDHTPFLWHRWFSPPVNLVFLTYYWVQSAPCLQRTSVTQWAPVWMAQKGCLLPAQACSSSTSIRTMENVSNPTHTQPESQLFMCICDFTLPVCTTFLHCLVFVLFSALQQHGADQCLLNSFQSRIPVPVHPVQFQNHLPLLALPDGCCQVSIQQDTPNFMVERVYDTTMKGVTFLGSK